MLVLGRVVIVSVKVLVIAPSFFIGAIVRVVSRSCFLKPVSAEKCTLAGAFTC